MRTGAHLQPPTLQRQPAELTRHCACGGTPGADGECAACKSKRLSLQRRVAEQQEAESGTAPPIVHDVLRSSGRPLDAQTRGVMEERFGHDFGSVRVHTDERAAESARAVSAAAYTVGREVVFDRGRYAPGTSAGLSLVAHELAHVVQQGAQPAPAGGALEIDEAGSSLERTAEAAGADPVHASESSPEPLLQRQTFTTPSPAVRLPAAEEFVTQLSTVEAGVHGRALRRDEVALARPIFGSSIDYSRVRLIPGPILEYRTVGNTIRIPSNFTIADEYMAQTLIHELTHVWQYQQAGTSYLSISLGTQLAGAIETGSRNAAYDYRLTPRSSFFDFRPEQQGLIVENYFAMLRDRNAPPTRSSFVSNHVGPSGEFPLISRAARQAEIAAELPLHEPLIRQLQAAIPRPELDLLRLRASEVMRMPGEGVLPISEERQLTPIKPLLEVRF
jgi:Domain of unknown function (DUF4157)